MKIIDKDNKIAFAELELMAENMFGDLIKAVVDIENEIIALDAELHADEEKELLVRGSRQENLWGINLYPEEIGDDFIEFDSMINLRPSWGNKSRGIDDKQTQAKIVNIVNSLVER
jgi:hypothetical protein